jgi:lysine 2,3-aminomutase
VKPLASACELTDGLDVKPDPDSLDDPTGDRRLRPLPFLVRKHGDRAVILASFRCFSYCRFCFRRGQVRQNPTHGHWRAIRSWLAGTPEVQEVILSGGDPLTLPDDRLREIVACLEGIPHLERWRIHTRAPVVFPGRIRKNLICALQSRLPLRVVIHANHPSELSAASLRAVKILQVEGIPVLNQSVLLATVNARVPVLVELNARLVRAGIRPYYLHHPDRIAGTSRFRVSIERGLQIYRDLLRVAPSVDEGGTTPPYVLDLPNGAGKCRTEALVPIAEERSVAGRRICYRWVRPMGWDAVVQDLECEWWDVWESSLG